MPSWPSNDVATTSLLPTLPRTLDCEWPKLRCAEVHTINRVLLCQVLPVEIQTACEG